MALADYQPETRVIPFKGGSFEVKGLSLVEVTTLIRHHLPDLEALFDLGSSVLDGKADITENDLVNIAVALAEQAPGFTANLIALASGEVDAKGQPCVETIAAAGRLTFPLQVKALVTIGELTFAEVGGVKKAMESVAGLLATKTAVTEASKNLLNAAR